MAKRKKRRIKPRNELTKVRLDPLYRQRKVPAKEVKQPPKINEDWG